MSFQLRVLVDKLTSNIESDRIDSSTKQSVFIENQIIALCIQTKKLIGCQQGPKVTKVIKDTEQKIR